MANPKQSLGRLLLSAGLAGLLSLQFNPATAQIQETTLRVGANQIPPDLGNPFKAIGSPASYTFSAIFDALTFVGEPGGAAPALGTSWQNVDDTTWRVNVRPGVTFANGEPMNAAAVVATVNWLMSDEGKVLGNRAAFELSNLAGAAAIDDMTVEFKTKAPSPIFDQQLDVLSIVPPKAWADLGVEGFVKAPMGTGPFKATDFRADQVKMTAFEGSWRKPHIRNVEIFGMRERPSRLQGFLSGQLHIATQVTPDDFEQVRAAGGVIDSSPSPQNLSVALVIDNAKPGATDNTPLQDKRVRQALNYAVNNVGIVENLLSNVGANAAASVVPQIANGFNGNLKPYPYDPDKAKQLLAEAGYADGFDLKVEFVCGGLPADCDIHQQWAQDLGKIGIRVQLENLAFPGYIQKLLKTEWDGNAFVSVNDSLPTLDAMNAFKKNTCRWPKPFYCPAGQEAVLDAIDTEMNAGKRRQLLANLAETYYDEAPHIFLTGMVDLHAISPKLKNFKSLARNFNYEDLVFEE